MKDKIRIMIIDDIKETRENIKRLISLEDDLMVIAEVGDGEEGIKVAKESKPDIILMDINLPGMDGLKATELISQELPDTSIIIISVQEEIYYMRRAMSVGAREFLMKPFSRDELMEVIRRVYSFEQKKKNYQEKGEKAEKKSGEVISIFSGKGGVGKTTIAVNLAIAIARLTGEETVLLDLDLQFGDVALSMNLVNELNLSHLAGHIDKIDSEGINDYLLTHQPGNVKILAAPQRPEEAELIKNIHIKKILSMLKERYRYILIDTETAFHENNLAALDFSDKILLISQPDLASVKNVHLSLQIMDELGYSRDKIYLILNRSDRRYGLQVKDVKRGLNLPLKALIPDAESVALRALNTGEPFVLSNTKAAISKSIFNLAKIINPEIKESRSIIPGIKIGLRR